MGRLVAKVIQFPTVKEGEQLRKQMTELETEIKLRLDELQNNYDSLNSSNLSSSNLPKKFYLGQTRNSIDSGRAFLHGPPLRIDYV